MSARRLGALWVLLLALASPAAPAHLPVAVDGKPLPTLAPMLRRAMPAVVNISAVGHVDVVVSPLLSDPFFRRFFDLPELPAQRETKSLGSGVIVDAEKGYILTNHHVIENADRIRVGLADGRQFDARLIGSDPASDIAVIRIEAPDLVALPMADSDQLQVGDFVVAIGNPFGLGQTATSGIISALGRTGLGIEGFEDFIQTDASINPGNSGGALVNLRGELVGINAAIIAPGGGNVGIGFAIPINMARSVMEQIIRYGHVRRGQLGILAQDVTPDLARAFGIRPGGGAVITRVFAHSPAARAGLQPGDVILRIDGHPVRSAAELRARVGTLRIGQKIRIDLLRNGRPFTITTRLAAPEHAVVEGGRLHPRLAGARLEDIEEDMPEFGRIKGVRVAEVYPRSPAAAFGLRPGDIIVAANGQPVGDLEALRQVLAHGGRALRLNIVRGNARIFLFAG
ncbi:MAG: DegQ family serine endoprotease [Gammaproteobacteria bacterium]|nr:MAG: DegQ family serine endoprotease [Gammaproteobacteria bacterium]